MKKIFILILIAGTQLLSSCGSDKLDMAEAKKTAESAINYMGNKKFDDLYNLYTNDFAHSERKEVREAKINEIITVIGAVENYTLIDSVAQDNFGEESNILLTYQVKHANLTSKELFTIILEDGKYLIAKIDIQGK
jgi:hypothetical protein